MKKFKFNPKLLTGFFDEKIRENCKNCKRYGKKTSCPPNIDSVEYYRTLLPRYSHGVLLVEKIIIDDISNWAQLGTKSSLIIHEELLDIRKGLLQEGKFALIFGAGSCKNCLNCSLPCKVPEKSVIPIEATGINVIEIVESIANVKIVFPVESQKYFYRIGMVLYD